jgi:hypothetical protein
MAATIWDGLLIGFARYHHGCDGRRSLGRLDHITVEATVCMVARTRCRQQWVEPPRRDPIG